MVATFGDKRTVVHVRYPCYVCGDRDGYKAAASLLSHLEAKHNQRLPNRSAGINRPSSKQYRYENDINSKWDELHYGCPSCWFHSENFDEFQAHFEDENCEGKPKQKQTTKNSEEKRLVHFKDQSNQNESEEEEPQKPDLNKAGDIAQQIVDLGNLLKKMLKM